MPIIISKHVEIDNNITFITSIPQLLGLAVTITVVVCSDATALVAEPQLRQVDM